MRAARSASLRLGTLSCGARGLIARFAFGGPCPTVPQRLRAAAVDFIRFQERCHGFDEVVGHRIARDPAVARVIRVLEQKPRLGEVFAPRRCPRPLRFRRHRSTPLLCPMKANRLYGQQHGQNCHDTSHELVQGQDSLHASSEEAGLRHKRLSEPPSSVNPARALEPPHAELIS